MILIYLVHIFDFINHHQNISNHQFDSFNDDDQISQQSSTLLSSAGGFIKDIHQIRECMSPIEFSILAKSMLPENVHSTFAPFASEIGMGITSDVLLSCGTNLDPMYGYLIPILAYKKHHERTSPVCLESDSFKRVFNVVAVPTSVHVVQLCKKLSGFLNVDVMEHLYQFDPNTDVLIVEFGTLNDRYFQQVIADFRDRENVLGTLFIDDCHWLLQDVERFPSHKINTLLVHSFWKRVFISHCCPKKYFDLIIRQFNVFKVMKLKAVEKIPFEGVFQLALPPQDAGIVDKFIVDTIKNFLKYEQIRNSNMMLCFGKGNLKEKLKLFQNNFDLDLFFCLSEIDNFNIDTFEKFKRGKHVILGDKHASIVTDIKIDIIIYYNYIPDMLSYIETVSCLDEFGCCIICPVKPIERRTLFNNHDCFEEEFVKETKYMLDLDPISLDDCICDQLASYYGINHVGHLNCC